MNEYKIENLWELKEKLIVREIYWIERLLKAEDIVEAKAIKDILFLLRQEIVRAQRLINELTNRN